VSVIEADPSVQLLDSPRYRSVPRLRALSVGHVGDAPFAIDPPPVKRAFDAAVAQDAIGQVCTHVGAVRADGPNPVSAVAKEHHVVPSETYLRRLIAHVHRTGYDVPRLWVRGWIRRLALRLESGVSVQSDHAFFRARKK
jgi:hypothetical protein